ncbi:MAG: CRISPR-associated protein Csx15 [Caldilineaceae bacterium]
MMMEPEESSIQSEGGAVVGESVTIRDGNFIGRDQINITVILPPLPSTAGQPVHERNLYVLNFARPLTMIQRQQIEELVDKRIGTIIDITVSFQFERPIAPQCVSILDAIGFAANEWQTFPLIVNLPGFSSGAGCLLSELHGRMGHFPAIVRLSPQMDSIPIEYIVAEVINLQQVRDKANRRQQSAQPLFKSNL